jgi:hypothetical protein
MYDLGPLGGLERALARDPYIGHRSIDRHLAREGLTSIFLNLPSTISGLFISRGMGIFPVPIKSDPWKKRMTS